MMLTLLTDFGWKDIYVGVMKGVIAQISPQVQIIDLTHDIPPQDVGAAQFNLRSAWPYFPTGTVHLVVVDPGVGGTRRAIAVALKQGYLVGPDNGVFTGVLRESPALLAVELTNPVYWLTPSPSATFHGRDIFAPVAAHLAQGVSLQELGREIDPATLVQLPLPTCTQIEPGIRRGSIQYCDRFGNLVTNIPANVIAPGQAYVLLDGTKIPMGQTYSDQVPGQAIALVGSHGWLEIAVNQGSAQQQLGSQLGDTLEIISIDP